MLNKMLWSILQNISLKYSCQNVNGVIVNCEKAKYLLNFTEKFELTFGAKINSIFYEIKVIFSFVLHGNQ